VWALEVHIPDLDQAVISYAFVPYHDGQASESDMNATAVWRGADASPPAERAATLQGQIERVPFASAALGETRMLTVYTPPGYAAGQRYPVIYMADGDHLPEFAPYLEPLIVNGTLPPSLLIGAASGGRSASGADLRAQEYLPTFNPERFSLHEQFFTDELRQWAEATYGAVTERDQRAVFGYSNGGVFAAAMGYRHPDLYGHILAFSLGVSPGELSDDGGALPDFYFTAGTLEGQFLGNTASAYGDVRRAGAEAVFNRRVAGHDLILWQEAFPGAVVWAFARPLVDGSP
jgi:predicted esterase